MNQKTTKHLPSSLAIRDAKMRKALLHATAQPGIGIVLNLLDRKQPFPHAGVILQGREIIGWVFGQVIENLDYDDGTDVLEWIDYSMVLKGGRLGNEVFHCVDTPSPLSVHIRETVHKAERGVVSRWRYRHSAFDSLFSEAEPLTINRIDALMFGEYLSTIRQFRTAGSLDITDRI